MKRVFLIVVLLVVLVGATVFFMLPRGASEGAQLVPGDSVLYLTLPDVQRTINRWPKTALAQIGAEPAVADFLNKPIGQLATSGGGIEALDLLFRVKPGRLFFAVTAVRETGADVLLGFQFFGGRKDVDDAMTRLYAEVGKKVPNAGTSTADYKGDTVTVFSSGSPTIFSAAHGSWGFIANSEAGLQQALDRAAGRSSAPSLASVDDFKSVSGRLSKDPDFLWYGKFKPVYDLLLTIGNQQNAAVNPKQFEQLEKMKAMGGTLLLDGENQKEISYIIYSGAPKLEPIDRSPMTLTTPETSLFLDSSLDLKTVASDEYFQSLPPAAQTLLTDAKIDLKKLPAILGNDLGVILSWSSSAMVPSVLVAIEVKDRAGAEALAQSALTGFGVPSAASQSNGATVFALPVSMQLIDPQLAVSDKFLIASLTSGELNRALSVKPGAPTLEGAPAFASVLPAYKSANQAFGYVDSKALFERIYNMVRPIALFAGAMSPSAGQFVDVQKLPDTESISRHLSPIIYTTQQTDDGMIIESSGPVTLSQAVMMIGAGAVASYYSGMAPH